MRRSLARLAFAFLCLFGAGCDWTDSAADLSFPVVSSTSPADDATGVPVDSSLSVTFSEPMDRGSVEAAFSSTPSLPAGTFSWTGNTVTFTPASPLPEWAGYDVTVGTGAADRAGNRLAAPFTFSFRTDDESVPAVSSTSPDNGALRVAVGSSVSVTFTEPMDRASVEAAISSVPSLPAGTFSWSDNTVTFTPSSPLRRLTEYVVTVGTGAADRGGNPIAAPRAFRWKTALPYTVLDLRSDFGASPTGCYGVHPSRDGEYVFWGDGPEGAGHLYRVRISDNASQTVWTNRNGSGTFFDDGTNTWVGSYNPYGAAYRIPDASPLSYAVGSIPSYHSIGLTGNSPAFPYAYFGSSSGDGVMYWNGTGTPGGTIPGTWGAYVYQSAVIGNRIYFPRGYYTTPGILVVDAIGAPTAVTATLLSGDSRLQHSYDVIADDAYLYVQTASLTPPTRFNFWKIDPTGTGTIVSNFRPSASFGLSNPVVRGGAIWAGANLPGVSRTDKKVYLIDKDTGGVTTRDCSAWLPTAVGSTRWDGANDGMWFGPDPDGTSRKSYFLPRGFIEANCP